MAVAFSPASGIFFYGGNTDVEGISVQGKSIDDINSIVQLKHGWQMVFDTIDAPLDLDSIKKLHLIIGRTSSVPVQNKVEEAISSILSSDREWTERALDLMLYLTKSQLFYDGNKRIAMLAANKLLIQHGCGVLSVSQDRLEKFFTLLVSYYEDDARAEELKEFLYNECLDGFKSMK